MGEAERSRILIVEGHQTRERLRQSLSVLPVELCELESAEEALAELRDRVPDLMLAEIRLPDASGFSLCRRVRETTEGRTIPIILMSSWASEMDRILAFESGADDFVAKPFFAREFASRVSAVLRRGRVEASDSGEGHRKDADAHSSTSRWQRPVRIDGRLLSLTPREQDILCMLADAEGRVLTRNRLIAGIWGNEAAPSNRNVDAHVKSLRRKLGIARDCVETVRGVGYRFSPSPHLQVG